MKKQAPLIIVRPRRWELALSHTISELDDLRAVYDNLARAANRSGDLGDRMAAQFQGIRYMEFRSLAARDLVQIACSLMSKPECEIVAGGDQ